MDIISALVYNLDEYGALFTAYMVHNLDDPWQSAHICVNKGMESH